jgi:hypothetical protein
MVMMWIAAAAALAATPAQPSEWRATATVQATASIRIISGVVLKFDAPQNAGAPPAHDGQVTTEDGMVRPARLIEFQ